MDVTWVTTCGTDTDTCQDGSLPDLNATDIRSGFNGYTQGVVVDLHQLIPVSPVTDFVTSKACYKLSLPAGSGSYLAKLHFSHHVGNPRIRTAVADIGDDGGARGATPCANTLSFVISVSPDLPSTPSFCWSCEEGEIEPEARVYEELPMAETARIRFELEGPPVATPGGEDITMRFFATSRQEFSAYEAILRFPAEHLEVVGIEQHPRPGLVDGNNDLGACTLFMNNSRRRLGREGERVHLATLRFRVKPEARDVGQVSIRFETLDGLSNWLSILNSRDLAGGVPPVAMEVAPLFLLHGLINIEKQLAAPGDANLDHVVNLSDVVVVLQGLFLGLPTIACSDAADFDGSGTVNITDPVAILSHLFQGGPPAPARDVSCAGGG